MLSYESGTVALSATRYVKMPARANAVTSRADASEASYQHDVGYAAHARHAGDEQPRPPQVAGRWQMPSVTLSCCVLSASAVKTAYRRGNNAARLCCTR